MNFSDKLSSAIARNQSLICVGLEPNPEVIPAQYSGKEHNIDRLWDWMQFTIESTANHVCAYKPTLGFYLALGAPGLELLIRLLNAIPDEIPIILDAKHSDLNSSTVLAQTVFEQWQVDAITLNPYVGQDIAARFLKYADKAVFIQCHTANTTAQEIQDYPNNAPLYLEIAKQCRAWGTAEQLGLEVGASNPEALEQIRAIAPERTILVRSIWANPHPEQNLTKVLEAGLNSSGEGLIIPANQDILQQDHPVDKIRALQEQIQVVREKVSDRSTCSVWFPKICLLERHPHTELILQLYDIGCIMFGNYVQASGDVFPYYIDLRKIISNPQIFNKVLNAYAEILNKLTFDRIAGIPYGSLPTATGLSLRLNYPMIFPRKEVKAHGARRLIEGNFEEGETIVVVDDILITGKSVMEGADKLKSSGLCIKDIVVFIDHENGVKHKMNENGYHIHAVLKITEITDTLYQSGYLDEEQFQALVRKDTK
jgi:uridine monophosphate synthetase